MLTAMVRDGVLLRTYRGQGSRGDQGVSKLPAYLDDYAEMANGLVDLYEATFDVERLIQAKKISEFLKKVEGEEELRVFFDVKKEGMTSIISIMMQ